MGGLRGFWASRGDWIRGVMFALGFLVIWGVITLPLYLFLPRSDVFKDVSAVLQSFITALAIAAGGYFALFKLQVFRNLQPHLTISHEITHRFIGDGYVHISVTALLHNRSKVKVDLLEGFFRLQQVAPTTDEEIEQLYEQVFEGKGGDEHVQWAVLDTHTLFRKKGELVVEPGESHPETYEFIVSRGVESVLIYTFFRNPTYPGAGAAKGWQATTVYDMIPVSYQ